MSEPATISVPAITCVPATTFVADDTQPASTKGVVTDTGVWAPLLLDDVPEISIDPPRDATETDNATQQTAIHCLIVIVAPYLTIM